MAERFRRRDSLTDLHDAVLKNSIVELQSHIHNGVPLDVTDHEGKTALYYASEKGYLSLVEVLVKNGADMEIVNINGSSCLWEASHRGYDQIVLYVLKSGANPNSQADDQTTALYWASYNGHAKCVYYLTRFNADPSQTKNTGASALFVAARNGHHCIVKHLLKCGVDANLCQQDMRSPIHTALLYHRKRCVKFLLKWNVCVTNTDMYGLSVLHFAAKCGKLKAARIILNHLRRHNLLDTDASDNFGNTCLHLAVVYGNYKLACYFISKGFNINKQNIHGWSPLHMAAMVGNDSLLKHMLEKKADCSLVTRQNETGHQIAGRYRRHSSVQLFLPSEQLSVDPLLNVNTLRDYLSLLSVTNTIGVIKYTDEEQLIKEEVETYVKHLLIHVEHLNSIFKCEIIPSGSFYEYTRVGFPTEFDFMINLIWFGRICEFQQLEEDPAGFGRLLVTNDKTHKELEQYIEPITQCLSSEKIRKRFYQLLTSARSHVIRKESTWMAVVSQHSMSCRYS
ncbi:unnamed protein product [Didymodactylos carnosus]|uniref:Uncharacterized protein n=1 Tax=Didymodactylos carnosus TaxID=1234261 RepID=A0A814MMS7_9BILA|nr:unnamed protein product [Didymodactylos carnosus]CAF3847003.1 unnamed protein product [Didymodactylos carnosus]